MRVTVETQNILNRPQHLSFALRKLYPTGTLMSTEKSLETRSKSTRFRRGISLEAGIRRLRRKKVWMDYVPYSIPVLHGIWPDVGKLSSAQRRRLTVSNNGWLACRLMLSATLCPWWWGGGGAEQVRGYCLIRRKISSTRGIQSRTCVFTAHASGGRWGCRQSEVYRIPSE